MAIPGRVWTLCLCLRSRCSLSNWGLWLAQRQAVIGSTGTGRLRPLHALARGAELARSPARRRLPPDGERELWSPGQIGDEHLSAPAPAQPVTNAAQQARKPAQELKEAKCMRTHGFPDFPGPNVRENGGGPFSARHPAQHAAYPMRRRAGVTHGHSQSPVGFAARRDGTVRAFTRLASDTFRDTVAARRTSLRTLAAHP